MQTEQKHLDRARIAEWILGFSGLAIIVLGLNAKWFMKYFPSLVYIIVILAFIDLGVFLVLIVSLVLHFRRTTRMQTDYTLSSQIKILMGMLVVSLVVEAIYATLYHAWNSYSLAILIGLLFSITAIPFHVLHSEYHRKQVS